MRAHISLAWAINVDHAQLGALLEAYVFTKATITTLRACMSHLSKPLPTELIDLIGDVLKDTTYRSTIAAWNSARFCVKPNCQPIHHLGPVSFDDLFEMDRAINPEEEARYLWHFGYRHSPKRCEAVREYLHELSSKLPGKLAACIKIFEDDFGIRPYFRFLEEHKTYQPLADNFISRASAKSSGYLTLPIVQIPLGSRSGQKSGSYALAPTVVGESLQKIPDNVKQKFARATSALRLQIPHRHVTVDLSFEEYRELCDKEIPDAEVAIIRATTLRIVHASRYKTFCVDCGTRRCRGTPESSKPEIMILGQGQW